MPPDDTSRAWVRALFTDPDAPPPAAPALPDPPPTDDELRTFTRALFARAN